MLTYNETILAIKNLRTDPDIILRASRHVALLEEAAAEAAAGPDMTDVKSISQDIVRRYFNAKGADTANIIVALAETSAFLASASVRPDGISHILHRLLETFTNAFTKGLAGRTLELMKKDPDKATELMKAIITLENELKAGDG